MITPDYSGIELKLKQVDGKIFVYDTIRKKWLVLTPEEHVRQHFLYYIIHKLHYPVGMIAVEKKIMTGLISKRFDIVVYDRNHKPWMLIECKAPDVMITEAALNQLLQYHNTMQCNYWILTNGHQNYCADACDIKTIKWVETLPAYDL